MSGSGMVRRQSCLRGAFASVELQANGSDKATIAPILHEGAEPLQTLTPQVVNAAQSI